MTEKPVTWASIGRSLAAGGLHLLGGALGGPAGAAVGGMVGKALGLSGDAGPESVARVVADQPAAAMPALRKLEADNQHELAKAMLNLEATGLRETGATYRAELAQDDLYTRRARPTLIYFLALACMVMITTACAVVFFDPAQLGALATLYDALTWPLVVLASGAGIYVRSRSTHDKVLSHGHPPPAGGLLQAIARKVAP